MWEELLGFWEQILWSSRYLIIGEKHVDMENGPVSSKLSLWRLDQTEATELLCIPTTLMPTTGFFLIASTINYQTCPQSLYSCGQLCVQQFPIMMPWLPSCVCNTHTRKHKDDHRLELVAQSTIREGEQVWGFWSWWSLFWIWSTSWYFLHGLRIWRISF